MILAWLIILVILITLSIIFSFYFFYSYGLYTIAVNRGLEYAWLAWIPLVNRYLLGELTGNEMWGFKGSKWILPFGPIVSGLLSFIFIGVLLEVVYTVYYYMVLFKLYKQYSPRNTDIYIIISILFRFMINIFIFLIRNKEPVQETIKSDYSESVLEKSNSRTETSQNSVNEITSDKNSNLNPEVKINNTNEEPIDFNEIDKNINEINKQAEKVSHEVPGKPIELYVEPGKQYLDESQKKQEES